MLFMTHSTAEAAPAMGRQPAPHGLRRMLGNNEMRAYNVCQLKVPSKISHVEAHLDPRELFVQLKFKNPTIQNSTEFTLFAGR
jgi:hypothetical protein